MILNAILLFALTIVSFFVYYSFSSLIHELGHGIPALLYTNEKVTLYVGSMGDSKGSFKIKLGRLELVFKMNIFKARGGLCRIEKSEMSYQQQMIFVIMGPVATLLLALVLAYLAFFTSIHDNLKTIFFIFCLFEFASFLKNLIPSDRPVTLSNGNVIYNDGRQLKDLLVFKVMSPYYVAGVTHYNNEEYALAAQEFEKVLQKGYDEQIIFKILIFSYLRINDKAKAIQLNGVYNNKYLETFDANDYGNSALIKSYSEAYNDAIAQYDKALESQEHREFYLNNRGYTYNLMGKYELGLQDFEEALKLNDSFAYALNNRGFSKIKLGFKEDGLKDLNASMKLDDLNSYCYLNFGIYHFENMDYEKAQDYFLKAQELDETTVSLNDYLDKLKNHLNH